jgi:hypothetical protein
LSRVAFIRAVIVAWWVSPGTEVEAAAAVGVFDDESL